MTPAPAGELLRAPLFHTPRNPFVEERALVSHLDGGLVIQNGRIVDCGDFQAVRKANPDADVVDMRGGFLLPGLVDTHVHFPQVRVLGCLGLSLLDWLEQCALPEEARMADVSYACRIAQAFIHGLASHGTTTAMVFGAHFAPATAALFEVGDRAGLRIASGLVLSDRGLRPELLQTPESAYKNSTALIQRFHRRGGLRYAVTPRFALSTSETMLEVCQTLLAEHPGLHLQTHLNENTLEVEQVNKAFPWAKDYLAVYERFGLAGRSSIMAHNIHATDSEIERLAGTGTTIAHCPASNAALGSGLFPLRRHVEARVRCALGTDVGGGTGFGILKEGLQAYLTQRVIRNGWMLDPAQLLYLATRAGAEALGMETEIGDFSKGRAADFIYLRPPDSSPLAEVLSDTDKPDRILSALFTMAGSESVREVRVEGAVVYPPPKT